MSDFSKKRLEFKEICQRLRKRLLGQDQDFREAVRTFPYGQSVTPAVLRQRIEREDGLLNTRTSIFLLFNGLAGVTTTTLSTYTNYCWLASLLAVVVNVLWFYCARQCLRVLAALTRCLLKTDSGEPVDKLVQQVLGPHHFRRPSTILAVYLPGLAVLSWFAVFLATSPRSSQVAGVLLVVAFAIWEIQLIRTSETEEINEGKSENRPTPESGDLPHPRLGDHGSAL